MQRVAVQAGAALAAAAGMYQLARNGVGRSAAPGPGQDCGILSGATAEECIRNADPMDVLTESILLRLFDIGAVKFGKFTLKSGVESPIYIDLRMIVSVPTLLRDISKRMYALVTESGVAFDAICGVPYTALPIATVMSLVNGKPMLMRRKEVKKYGTKKQIEGIFKAGQRVLVVEDLITSGMSVMETTKPLNNVGLVTTDVVVLVDREQGGSTNLDMRGIKAHAVLKISSMLKCLLSNGRVDMDLVRRVVAFLRANQVVKPLTAEEKKQAAPSADVKEPAADSKENPEEPERKRGPRRMYTYLERSQIAANATARRLLAIMAEKKTNLCFSADITDKKRLLEVVDAVGPHICMLKTHIDTLNGFDVDVVRALQALAKKHNFLIFEDRKFADIGNTVKHQYGGGTFQPVEWSDLVNAHPLPGPGIVDGLKSVGGSKGRGLVLIAEMSSKGNLATGDYTAASVKMALANKDYVMGFISMRQLCSDPGMIHMTPGVKLNPGTDALGQQYRTPNVVINQNLSDVIIVGRGIYQAEDPAASAIKFKQAGWEAYEKTLKF